MQLTEAAGDFFPVQPVKAEHFPAHFLGNRLLHVLFLLIMSVLLKKAAGIDLFPNRAIIESDRK